MWARIEGNTVAEIIDFSPEGRFHKSLVFVPCNKSVRVGFYYSNGEFIEPDKPPVDNYAIWKAERADKVSKLTVEVDGMVFDANKVAWKDMSAAVAISESDDEEALWTLANNDSVIVTAGTLRKAARAAGRAISEVWPHPEELK